MQNEFLRVNSQVQNDYVKSPNKGKGHNDTSIDVLYNQLAYS